MAILRQFLIADPLEDLAALKAFNVIGIESGVRVLVKSMTPFGGEFVWLATSSATPDDINTVLPTGHGVLGRWLRKDFIGLKLSATGFPASSILNDSTISGTTVADALNAILLGVGMEFWIKKTVTSSAILEASNVDITGVSTGGELAIEDVVVVTDATGLATGTNFELLSNNTKGLANIFVEAVANLGANKTVDLDTASVTGIRTVLEVGKKLQVHSTVAACTGAGTIDVYVKFQRLAAGATISPL